MSWKHWLCLFPQHGPGHKHERPIILAEWQSDVVEDHPADFLRGHFHSDGCRVRNWATKTVQAERRRYNYGRWQPFGPAGGFGVPAGGVARLDSLIGPKT